MKKTLALLLALTLAVGCLAPTLAVEEPTEERALYEQYGPWGEWTEEQKAAAESWSDEDWGVYWEDYEQAVFQLDMQYWEDYDAWSYGAYSETEEDSYWEEYLKDAKMELGMPYPDGINVSLNGVYQDFGGVAPMAVAGRTMVPFRAFFEGVGAAVRFQDGEITADLKDGGTVKMKIGSTDMEIQRDGETGHLDMEVAPYVQSSVTYIPVRFAGEALGLDVYWDSDYACAHLTDWAALQAEVDSHLTSLNAILAASLAAVDPEQTYATTERVTLSGTLYGEKENDTAQIAMDVDGLARGANASAEVQVTIDLGGLRDTLFSMVPDYIMEVLDSVSDSRYSLIVNGEEGIIYAKGDKLSTLSVGTLPDDTWIGTRIPVGYLPAPGEITTLGQALITASRSSGYFYRTSPWEQTMNSAQPILLMMGDGSFVKKTTGTTTTYTLETDMLTLAQRAVELGMVKASDIAGFITGASEIPDVSLKFTAAVQGEKLTSFDMAGGVKMKGPFPMEVSFQMGGSPMNATGIFTFKGSYVGKVEMSMSTQTAPTSRTLSVTPPAGEVIIDWDVAMGYLEPGVPEAFGAERYTKAVLDAIFKDTYDSQWLAAAGLTEGEARERYGSYAKANAEDLIYGYALYYIDDYSVFEALSSELFAKARYELASDGESIAVTVSPLDVLSRTEETAWPLYEEEDGDWMSLVETTLREKLKTAGYLEPETLTLVMVPTLDGGIALSAYELRSIVNTAIGSVSWYTGGS